VPMNYEVLEKLLNPCQTGSNLACPIPITHRSHFQIIAYLLR